MVDFKKNRMQYNKRMGLTENDISSHKDIEQQIQQNEVEDEFVMVDKSKQDPGSIRRSHIVRQLEENELGIKEEDYNKEGEFDLELMNKRKSEGRVA
jgi:hypothetical protein